MAVIRTLPASVYYLQPNGVDDTANINAIFSLLAGGASAKIIFTDGTYHVSSQILYQMQANQHLTLEGQGNIVINSTVPEPGSEYGIFEFVADSGSTARLTMRNIAIAHTNSGAGLIDGLYIAPYGSNLTSFANVVLDSITITGASLWGARLFGVQKGMIWGCTMSSNRDGGLGLTGCNDIKVWGGDYSNNVTGALTGDYGVSCVSSSIFGPSTNIFIEGIQASNNGRKGIDVHHGHHIHITNNDCIGNGYVGIYAVAENSSKDVGDIFIRGNYIDQTGGNATLSQIGIQVGASGTLGSVFPDTFVIEGNKVTNVTANSTVNVAFYVNTPTSGSGPDKVLINNNSVENVAGASAGYIVKTESFSSINYMECCGNIFHAVSASTMVWVQKVNDFVASGNILKVDAGPPSNCFNIDTNATAIITANDIEGIFSGTINAVGSKGFCRFNTLNGALLADSSFVTPFVISSAFEIDSLGHLLSLASGTPTLSSVNANVSGATVSGNDTRGIITFNVITGTIAAGTALFTINFANNFTGTFYIILSNASNQTNGEFHYQVSGNSFLVYPSSSLAVATSYKVAYMVLG